MYSWIPSQRGCSAPKKGDLGCFGDSMGWCVIDSGAFLLPSWDTLGGLRGFLLLGLLVIVPLLMARGGLGLLVGGWKAPFAFFSRV